MSKTYRAKKGTKTEQWIGNEIVKKGNAMMCTETEWFVLGPHGGTLVPADELEEVQPPSDYEEQMKRAWGSR